MSAFTVTARDRAARAGVLHTSHGDVPTPAFMPVGTTTVRVLETVARTGQLAGRTTLFITPGFEFRRVDALLTNFHLPRSTLLALVMAFIGEQAVRELYREAIAERYRFYSFGDAMLVL